MTQHFTKALRWAALAISAAPALSLAAVAVPGSLPPASPINSLSDVAGLMCAISYWIFLFLIILAIIFVLVAAFKYLTASGDEEKIKAANHQLIYAAVAVIVALIARGFPLIVGSLVNSTFTVC